MRWTLIAMAGLVLFTGCAMAQPPCYNPAACWPSENACESAPTFTSPEFRQRHPFLSAVRQWRQDRPRLFIRNPDFRRHEPAKQDN